MTERTFFTPAAFELYEFDGRGDPARRDGAPRRWFSAFDGLIGAPAEQVHLGWSNGPASVIVCTSGLAYDTTQARARAAHLALGGDALPIPARPATPLDTHRTTDGISRADALWSAWPATAGGTRTPGGLSGPGGGEFAETAAPEGFSLGYRRLDGVVVFLAAVGVSPAGFGIRPVADWAAYDVDVRTELPLGALQR
jgi:hypothetical protein